MSEKKQYTFEDWKTGKIYKALKDQSIVEFDYSIVKDVGWFPTHLYENGYMKAAELNKIDEAQKDSFFKAVANNVEYKIRAVKRQLDSAYKPKEYLEEIIKQVEDGISTFPNSYRIQVLAGEWSKLMMDYSIHQRLHHPGLKKGSFEIVFNKSIETKDRLERKISIPFTDEVPKTTNQLLRLTVSIYLLAELNHLFENKFTDKPSKADITREEIFRKAYEYKRNGMKVEKMFEKISKWLLKELGFTKEEIKERFDISLKESASFNRVVNNNPPYKK